MDGRTRYSKAKKVLQNIVGEEMHSEKLRRKIMMEIGTSENLISDTIKMMMELGMIREIDHMIFKIEKAEADV